MEIHIDRQGERFGPYSLEEVNQYLAAGNVLPTDLGWHEGMAEWVTVTEIAGVQTGSGGAPPPPPPVGGGSASTCPQCSAPVREEQVICMGCGHRLQEESAKKSKKGLLIGLAAGSGVLLIGLVLWLVLRDGGGPEGTGIPDSSENLGRRIVSALKSEDFSKYETSTMKAVTKDQFVSFHREGVNIMRKQIEDKMGDNPMGGKILKSFDKKMEEFGEEMDKEWNDTQSDLKTELTQMKESFNSVLKDAKGDGIDWSKAEFVEAKFNKRVGGMLGAEDLVQVGKLTIIVSADGKKYEIEQFCTNMQNIGWLSERQGPRWLGEAK
jgi:predicted nucleic acid-binding Zn ribbon protein